MNSTRTNEGGYEESDLRKKLNGEILNLFPAEFKALMAPSTTVTCSVCRLRKRFSVRTTTVSTKARM